MARGRYAFAPGSRCGPCSRSVAAYGSAFETTGLIDRWPRDDLELREQMADDEIARRDEAVARIGQLALQPMRWRSMATDQAGQEATVPGLQDHEPRSRAKVTPRVGEVLRWLREVVIGRGHEQEIHRLRNFEPIACHADRTKCRDPTLLRGGHQLVKGALARVDGIHDAVRLDGPCHQEGEMAVSRAQIRHHHAAPQVERRDDGVGIAQSILPGASGVQPPADRSGQTLEDRGSHGSSVGPDFATMDAASQLPPNRMLPILPCRSIDDQISFYESPGFEVTYRQKAPNVFAAIRRGAIELQFFTLKGYEPANSYSTCYVMVSDVDQRCADFRAGLKQSLGRIPTRGMPRIGTIGDMSYGVRQFLLTDPGGNIIRIGQPLDQTDAVASDEPLARLERALAAASLLLYSKEDPATTARVIDDALAATPDASDRLRVQAWVIRADAAHALGDSDLAGSLLQQIERVALDPADRASLVDELSRAKELRSTLG